MTGALGDKLERAIEGGTRSWLPGFAPALAAAKWKELGSSSGLFPDAYGTARARAGDPMRERDVQSELLLPEAFGAEDRLLVETLREEPASRYVELGLELATPTVAGSEAVIHRIRDALVVIASAPEIAAAVGPVTRVLHVVVPEGPEYDVSYSDPEVPFSVFVGVPPNADFDVVADLRLAESILHEAMHLQMTLVEDNLPLVVDADIRHHSPWQDRMRPVRGVLHGTYVFAVIRDFMGMLARDAAMSDAERRHCLRRADTASREIEVASDALASGQGLTPHGRRLVEQLRQRL